MTPPKFLFVPIYQSCNLRCPHCEFWRRSHTLTETSWADKDHKTRRSAVVAEFANLNPEGVVVTHGGESLLAWNEYLVLCHQVKSLGLRLFTVTNGTMISSLEKASELVIDGPSEINISLDSPRPELHDKFRGREGAFRQATRAVSLLIAAMKIWKSNLTVNVMLLVGRDTYLDLDRAYELALRELGADKLKLNMVQPSFGNDSGTDPFFAEQSDVDPEKLREVLLEMDAKYKLSFSPVWLNQVVMYFRSLKHQPVALGWRANIATTEHICNSYDRNIWLSDRSEMYLCCDSVNWHGATWEKPGDLGRFWIGAGALRQEMSSCNRLCGISHSLRNTSATVKK